MPGLTVLEMKTIVTISLLILTSSLYSEEMKEVKASDVGIDTVLVGDSGVEIGKVFLIEGRFYTEETRSHSGSEVRRLLEIKSVNGKQLDSKFTEQLWDSTELNENEWYTLRVVESARFSRFYIPSLSIGDIDEGRQIIYRGLKIIEIITN